MTVFIQKGCELQNCLHYWPPHVMNESKINLRASQLEGSKLRTHGPYIHHINQSNYISVTNINPLGANYTALSFDIQYINASALQDWASYSSLLSLSLAPLTWAKLLITMIVAIAAISLLFSLTANAAAVSVPLIKLFDSHWMNLLFGSTGTRRNRH